MTEVATNDSVVVEKKEQSKKNCGEEEKLTYATLGFQERGSFTS